MTYLSSPAASVGLVRGLGVLAASAIVIGDVIGTGVFLKARVMTCNVGDPVTVVMVWIVGGLLSLTGALTYAELSSMMPRAGGEYVFIRQGYGALAGFLYGWTRFFVASAGGAAGLAAGFAIFINIASAGAIDRASWGVDLGSLPVRVSGLQVVAIAAIVAVTVLNCAAIAFSGRVASAFTVLKITLVLSVGLIAMLLADGSWTHFALINDGSGCADVPASARGGAAGFGAAMLGALWGYNGWNEVTYVAEEVKDPRRNLPRAIIRRTAARARGIPRRLPVAGPSRRRSGSDRRTPLLKNTGAVCAAAARCLHVDAGMIAI